MARSILRDKSYKFAIDVVKVCRAVQKEQKAFVLTKQWIRSETAVGALLREAEFGQSKTDFAHKINIALKDANESAYWLNLLNPNYAIGGAMSSELPACRFTCRRHGRQACISWVKGHWLSG